VLCERHESRVDNWSTKALHRLGASRGGERSADRVQQRLVAFRTRAVERRSQQRDAEREKSCTQRGESKEAHDVARRSRGRRGVFEQRSDAHKHGFSAFAQLTRDAELRQQQWQPLQRGRRRGDAEGPRTRHDAELGRQCKQLQRARHVGGLAWARRALRALVDAHHHCLQQRFANEWVVGCHGGLACKGMTRGHGAQQRGDVARHSVRHASLARCRVQQSGERDERVLLV
jgi:hypothetical protein